MRPTRSTLMHALLAVVVCALAGPVVVYAQSGMTAHRGSERSVRTVFDQSVTLPPNDPRRVTLRDLEPGAVILVDVLPASADGVSLTDEIHVEILRRSGRADHNAVNQNAGISVFESVHLQQGAASGSIRYPVKAKGDYLVVIQWDGADAAGAIIRLLVKVDQPVPDPARTAVYTLPGDTRIAVAVFSAGLLWTTLLLGGVPIIRAFRARRRNAGHPWFS